LLAQDVERYSQFDDYMSHLATDDDKVYVVNYWATWCAPCIKELKYFEELGQKFKDQDVEVVLVSIDFENQYDKRLIPFIQKRGLTSRLIHMTDPNTNIWIDKVDPAWSGSIPATQIIKGKKKVFLEKSFEDLASLEKEITPFLNN